MSDPTTIELIFNAWNAHKQQGNAWKGHAKIAPEIQDAVRLRLRRYDLEDILAAIDNYAEVLLSEDFAWSYAWNLYQFLTRHNPQYRDELQLLRWLPNNFDADDYLPQRDNRQEPESNVSSILKEL